MQLVETFAMDGYKLDERVINSEKEYCDYSLEMSEQYSDECYTICTDLEEQ